MKFNIIFCAILFCFFLSKAQSPITNISVTTDATEFPVTYSIAPYTYNWATNLNNSTQYLGALSIGNSTYNQLTRVTGSIKLRRVNNTSNIGKVNLQWNEGIMNTATIDLFPAYESNEETYINDNAFNKGIENLFDNTSANSNNIERLDWILKKAYNTTTPSQTGFPIFDRGIKAAHDAFCIAAILTIDVNGNPASYGKILRVLSSNFGDPVAPVNAIIMKADPNNTLSTRLLFSGTSTENRGGVFISFSDLGITENTSIYGYSIFANDLPVNAIPDDLVDYGASKNFPLTTSETDGGLDFLAVTAVYSLTTTLPTHFISFDAVKNNDLITLKWMVENETSVDKYILQRSIDGKNYLPVSIINNTSNSTGANSYTVTDDVSGQNSSIFYYRIKQYDQDGSFYFSKSIAIKNNSGVIDVILYPNPVKDNLLLSINSANVDHGTIGIFNLIGVKLTTQSVALSKGNNIITVSGIDKLTAGMYQLLITNASGKNVSRQFIKI